jgi:arabinogalactan oligomer/maltooligosaccharide transport system substrate-binding protein
MIMKTLAHIISAHPCADRLNEPLMIRRFRLLSAGLLLLLMVLVAACSGVRDTSLDTLDGQLLVWHNWTPGAESEELNGLINGFTLIHPDVTIVTEYVPSEELPARFLDQTRAGLGPDVLVGVESEYIRAFADAGGLQPLTAYYPDTSTLQLESVNAFMLNGELYAIPFSSYTNVLFYNQSLVAGAPPATVPELLRMAQEGQRIGIPTDFYNAAWGIGSFGGEVFNAEGQLALNTNAGFADWLTWLSTAQRDPNVILSNDSQQLLELFQQGELTYFIGNSYELPYLQAAMTEEVVGVALLPPFGDSPAVPFLELEAIALSKGTASAPLGLELAQVLTNATQQRRLALSNLGRIPVSTRTGRVALRVDPLASALIQQRDNAIIVPLSMIETERQLIEFGDAIYNLVLEGELSPADAVSRLTTEMERVAP